LRCNAGAALKACSGSTRSALFHGKNAIFIVICAVIMADLVEPRPLVIEGIGPGFVLESRRLMLYRSRVEDTI
jgi:hypothetical protein